MVVQKKVVLHVDDDAHVATVVKDVLDTQGYHVVTAHSAQEGLRMIRSSRAELIILDISMPGMSGLTFLNQITSEEGTELPVIVFTAYARMVADEVREKIAGIMLKPATASQIIAEVDRVMAAQEALDNEDDGEEWALYHE